MEAEFRPARKAHPAILSDDVDRLAARLESYGFSVEWDDLMPEYRRFYAHDAHGNRLEFMATAKEAHDLPAPSDAELKQQPTTTN